MQNVATGENKVIAELKGFKIERIAWFGNETSLLVSAVVLLQEEAGKAPNIATNQVWLLSPASDVPRLLIKNADMAAPSPDGRSLACLRNGKTELWTSEAGGQSAHKIAQAINGDTFSYLLWSPRSDRIMTDRVAADLLSLADAKLVPTNNIAAQPGTQGRSAYESYDSHSGALLAHRDDVHFASAAMLADGTLIYLVDQRDGTTQFATARTDFETGAFRGPPVLLSGEQPFGVLATKAEDISVTADGGVLAMILERRNVDVYTADLTDLSPSRLPLAHIVRLTKHSNSNYPTSWTPDSKAVIFDTGINGPISVDMQALDTGVLQPLVQAKLPTDRFAQGKFSPDVRWLLYLHLNSNGHTVRSVERVPPAGGQSEIVLTTGEIEGFRCSISPIGRCVLREIEGNKEFVYNELDPLHGMGRELARTSLVTHIRGDWSVSPDGSTIAVATHDPAHLSVQLIHLPDRNESYAGSSQIKELPVPGYGVVLSPSWAKGGQSLFVQTSVAGERHLLYVDLRGHL